MSSWLDYTINGLIVGNVYALVAVGLALIFGVSRLINFAQGSIYLVGAYVGWVAVVQLRTPLILTIIIVATVANPDERCRTGCSQHRGRLAVSRQREWRNDEAIFHSTKLLCLGGDSRTLQTRSSEPVVKRILQRAYIGE